MFDLEVGAGMPGSTQPGDGSFVHLHVHSDYSMLDGAARVADLFSACEQMGMPAIAITDHGNTFGAYEFYKSSKATGIKPIIGMEAYVTPKTHRSERRRVRWGDGKSGQNSGDDVSGGGAFTHMTLWAENTAGMHEPRRPSTLATDGHVGGHGHGVGDAEQSMAHVPRSTIGARL